MALCKDDITTHVKKFHYNTIYPPRTDASPLEVLAKADGSLIRWGHLDDVFMSSQPLPEINVNQDPLDIAGNVSSTHDFTVGITILGKLIAAVGGNLGIKAAYKDAATLTFNYQEITRHSVMPVDLDRFISEAKPDPVLDTTIEILNKGNLFIFTAVLKAKKIVVEAEKTGGGSLAVDIPVIKQIVGGNIAVSVENTLNTKIGYEGLIPAAFAFKAVKLNVKDGRIRLKPVSDGSITAAAMDGPETEPDNQYDVMVFGDDYISLP